MPCRRSLALLLGLVACADRTVGGDTDATSTGAMSSSTSTAEPTSTGTTGDQTECLELMYELDEPSMPPWMATCTLPELCPGEQALVFQLGTGDIFDPQTVETDDLPRARCMAAALRDRTPGQIRWWSDEVGREYSLEILGDLVLARSIETITELIDGFDAQEALFALRPREFFEACAFGDAMEVWLCLMDAVEPGCLPGPLACPR